MLISAAALSFPAWSQNSLPPGARWLDHLNNELLPFWTTRTAFGQPFGAFPATRCDDTTLYDEQNPCPEIQRNPWIAPRQRHLAGISRQAYGYGVAFHLTGNRTYLDAMKAGVDFIRQNAVDRVNGGMRVVQNISDGTWGPAPELRHPYELAYGLLGMAFYYYLTRDPDVLWDILAVKKYIFDKFYNPSLGAMQWSPVSPEGVNLGRILQRTAFERDRRESANNTFTPAYGCSRKTAAGGRTRGKKELRERIPRDTFNRVFKAAVLSMAMKI